MKPQDIPLRPKRGFEKLPELLPELLKTGAFTKELSQEEKEKIELFEEGLKEQLREEDTIKKATEKIIKAALVIEFGSDFLKQKATKAMVETILRGIQGDSTLRKQTLIVISGILEKQKMELETLSV